jgi:hypothetical protein
MKYEPINEWMSHEICTISIIKVWDVKFVMMLYLCTMSTQKKFHLLQVT